MVKREKLNVLVTGSSSGFGRLIVETLARKGHVVFATMRDIHGKNAENAEALKQWARQNDAPVFIVELDICDEKSVKNAVDHIVDEAGYIDVVVNNAGIGSFGVNEAFTMDDISGLFDVNVLGQLRVNRAVLPYMRKRKKGLLIHVSSVLGRTIIPFMGAYSATKYALEAFAESYRYELAPLGIDSIIIEPAGYATQFQRNLVKPSEENKTKEYGVFADKTIKALSENMRNLEGPDAPDPQEVADAVVKLIETPAGKRPLRTAIGSGVDSVRAINRETDKIQARMLDYFLK